MNVRPKSLTRYWRLIAVLATLGLLTGILGGLLTPSSYRSSGSYVVVPRSTITNPETIVRSFDSLQSQGIIPTLLQLYRSESTKNAAGPGAGLSADTLRSYEVTADVLAQSNTVELNVTGPDATKAARLAAGIGDRGGQQFERLYKIYDVTPLDTPSPPDDSESPSAVYLGIIGGLLGGLLGLGLAALRADSFEALSRRRGTPHHGQAVHADHGAGPPGASAAPDPR